MTLVEASLADLEDAVLVLAEEYSPELWLSRVLPSYVGAAGGESIEEAEALFAAHHREFWAWLWSIEPGVRPDPFVGVWARGGAKSTSAELGCVALGARRRRRYGLYVCATQPQADDHVQNVGGMLESAGVAAHYPAMASRLVGKYGSSKGWRRNRLRTAAGFTLDAIGLDTASRGVKLDEQRPDFLVIDDIDDHEDSPKSVAKKIDLLTKALLPAGAPDLAVLAIQNLVHRDGVFARLVDGRATFLQRRRVSGPIPAVDGLVTKHEADERGRGRDVVIEGMPTWNGQPLSRVQEQIDDWGLAAFRAEAQHEVNRREGTLWVPEQLATVRSDASPVMELVVVAVDPSGGDGPDNDEQGIIVAGRDHAGAGWVLEDDTCRLSPAGWGDQVVRAWLEWDADRIVAEANYGGDMVIDVVKSAVERLVGIVTTADAQARPFGRLITMRVVGSRDVRIHVVHASKGKRMRAEPVAALYGRPDDPDTWSTSRVHHLGHFPELEDEMTSWSPDATWSPNRLDAAVWALTDLLVDADSKRRRRSIVASA